MKDKVTSIEIPKDLHRELKIFCAEVGKKVKDVTVKAIESYLKDQKWK